MVKNISKEQPPPVSVPDYIKTRTLHQRIFTASILVFCLLIYCKGVNALGNLEANHPLSMQTVLKPGAQYWGVFVKGDSPLCFSKLESHLDETGSGVALKIKGNITVSNTAKESGNSVEIDLLSSFAKSNYLDQIEMNIKHQGSYVRIEKKSNQFDQLNITFSSGTFGKSFTVKQSFLPYLHKLSDNSYEIRQAGKASLPKELEQDLQRLLPFEVKEIELDKVSACKASNFNGLDIDGIISKIPSGLSNIVFENLIEKP